ncbi:hypothetical protein NDA16_001183 [Ustilago loliicola]|nr:hypothetical protein NDA16_001183 [Ustilago loliicola]
MSPSSSSIAIKVRALVTEFIESRSMEDVFNSDQREHLACMMRLEALVEKMKKYTRPEPSSFVGEFIPPGRLCIDRDSFTRIVTSDKFNPDAEFPFCHGDISRFNVLIHPERPEIIALVDWEFAGFYPHQLDPSYAEQDDHGVALGWVSIQAQLFGQACLLRVQNKEERHGNMVQMLGFHNPFD